LRPGHAAFQGVDQHAVILQILPQIGVGEASLLPGFGYAGKTQLKSAVFAKNLAHFTVHVAAEVLLAVGEAEHQALLHGFETQLLQEGIGNCAFDVIQLHHDIRLFGIRNAENRREAKFTLHHFSAGSLGVFPVAEHIAEPFAVFGLPTAEAQGDFCQDAKAAFAAHHDLVKIRSGRSPWMGMGFEDAARGHIFLIYDDILNFPVIGGVLPRSAGDHPTANAGILKGLREVPDGIVAFGAQLFNRILQQVFKLSPPHARFDSHGLINFVQVDQAVHVHGHIQANAALGRLIAAGDC